ncbi:hypothetical protein CRUP_007198, partial [Coryphaenoides rupestris]
MESGSFQTELVSIMEILAKAAAAEINRRVDDSCAVLRLEITQSQHDIYFLKKKCELIEAELKRSRIRAKKKDLLSGSQADVLPIKEEGMEDGAWNNHHQDQSTRAEPLISEDFPEHYQADSLDAFPPLPGEQQHQQLIHDQLAVKRESNKALAAAVGSASAFLQDEDEEETERPLWAHADCRPSDVSSGDPGFSYRATRPQYAQNPSLFKNGLPAI